MLHKCEGGVNNSEMSGDEEIKGAFVSYHITALSFIHTRPEYNYKCMFVHLNIGHYIREIQVFIQCIRQI